MRAMRTLCAQRLRALWVAALVLLFTAGCMPTMYVDNGLPAVPAEAMPKSAQRVPVQLLFEFHTKGTLNARATDALKADVTKIVSDSGLFTSVSAEPVAGGGVLQLVLDNVPITDQGDAAAKGFVTGLTFGLAGSSVSDGYVCTADYLTPANTRIKRETRHAIHSTIGAKSAPPNSTKAKNPDAAVRTMTAQIVSNALKAVAEDPLFSATAVSP